MRDMDELFAALGRSEFRRRFRLGGKEAAYLRQKGLATIRQHARDFVTARLAEANPANDGRQTPMKNHPVFIAQHATATCCRGCLQKWHKIPKGKPLTPEQIDYLVEVIMRWLTEQNATVGAAPRGRPGQPHGVAPTGPGRALAAGRRASLNIVREKVLHPGYGQLY